MDIINFEGTSIELEHIILSDLTQTQRNKHDMYSLINGY